MELKLFELRILDSNQVINNVSVVFDDNGITII